MKRRIFSTITSLLTAVSCCFSGLAAPVSAVSFDAFLPLLSQPIDSSHFTSIACVTLYEYALWSASGNSAQSLLTDDQRALLDVDGSDALDTTDAYQILIWSAKTGATGVVPIEAQVFLDAWNAPYAESTTTLPESTTAVTTTTTTLYTTTAADTTIMTATTADMTTTSKIPASVSTTTVMETIAETMATTAGTSSAVSTTTTTAAEMITSSLPTTTNVSVTTAAPVTTSQTAGMGAWDTSRSHYNGIDVSKYQGNVDWEAVRADGVDFAIIRAGYGRYASQEDPYFDQNMRNAKAAGIACGAYWFSYAESPADAVQEAEVFAQVIEGYQFEYPLVFDIEASIHTKMTKEEVSAIITAFCSTMEEKGYYISVYSYAYFLNTYVYQSVLEKYDIWVAHFDTARPSYSKTSYGMWQYSSTGTVDGIQAAVDLDYSYRCYPNIMTRNGLNGF